MPLMDPAWTLLNPGYPNFGTALEARRGIADLRLLSDIPVGMEIARWRRYPLDRFVHSSSVGTQFSRLSGSEEFDLAKRGDVASHSVAVFVATANVPKLTGPVRLAIGAIDDDGVIYVNGEKVAETSDYSQSWEFDVTRFLKEGDNEIAIVVRNNDGAGGLKSPVALESSPGPNVPVALQFTTHLQEAGERQPYALDTVTDLARIERPANAARKPGDGKVVRTLVRFSKPPKAFAWEMVLAAQGDGFLRLNGHDLGRYWLVGPQRGFYLPASWLKDQNVLEFTAIPHGGSGKIAAAELRPLPEF
jgi:hypothetical protein